MAFFKKKKKQRRRKAKKKVTLYSFIFGDKKKKSKKKKGFLRRLFWRCFWWGGLAVGLYLGFCALTLPDLEKAIYRDRLPATTIVAENGVEVHTFGTVYSEVIHANEVPKYVIDAIIATEDRRFYSHFGLDFISFGRAMIMNIIHRRYAQGGSTITQQVAKNLFLSSKKNITRKVQELMMAFWLEYKFTKEQILTLYLNRVYLGAGTYGIEAASQKHFQKSSRDLNIREASIIAGMLKAPTRYNPSSNLEKSIERANIVLNNMLKNGYLTKDDVAMAKRMRVGPEKQYKVEGGRHFSDWAYSITDDYLGERDSDVYVLTTLDQKIQQEAEKILRETIAKNKDRNVTEGAIVVMDYSGAVKAMVGGTNYNKSQFNRAVQALRQPGSSFKPFVFITALEQGWGTMDKVDDFPLTIDKWKPENYDKKHYGEVTLLHALTKSLNLATIDLIRKVGGSDVISTAKKMGISTKIVNSPSLALGTFEVKVLDIAAAYATIANGGYAVFPYTVQEIYTKDGYQLYMREINPKTNRIISEKTTLMMKEMMANVINNGTGKRAKLPFFAAGKTGTTQDYRDAWFVGFTDKYVCAVWVGNDNNSAMKGVAGGGIPAEIWKKVMLAAHQN